MAQSTRPLTPMVRMYVTDTKIRWLRTLLRLSSAVSILDYEEDTDTPVPVGKWGSPRSNYKEYILTSNLIDEQCICGEMDTA